MTQKQFEQAAKILLSIISHLVAVCIVLTLILILNIFDTDTSTDISAQMIDEHLICTDILEVSTPIHANTPDITLEDKYTSVFKWQVYCGDFGVDQLYYLKDQCDKYEIPIEIMLSIICTESSFRSNATASTSSAAGYCQIIKGTAKWVYEDLLKYGDYDINNHTEIMTTNWKLNIELSCRLMYCLYWNSNQSWESAIQKYYGSGSDEANLTYLNRVNTNMFDLFGITISDI